MIMSSDDWSRATVCPHGCTRAWWTRVNPVASVRYFTG